MGNICASATDEKTSETVAPPQVSSLSKAEDSGGAELMESFPKATINVFGCRGLRNADWSWVPGSAGGASDPYVICKEKTGANSKQLLKTKVVSNSLEPIFDQEFDVDIAPESTLEFIVYDRDPLKPDDILGRAELKVADMANNCFNGELELKDAGNNIKAYIKVMVKMPGCDYPPGPATEFKITIQKGGNKDLGFVFDKSEKDKLFVTSISSTGLVKEYNNQAGVNEQMKRGQYIVAVNGVGDSSTSMAEELEKKEKLELSIVRPQCFTIAITKKGPLGLAIVKAPALPAVLITKVLAGPILEWNKVHTDKEVKVCDRIVAINGNREISDAMLTTDGTLQLVISRRYPPAGIAGAVSAWKIWDWF